MLTPSRLDHHQADQVVNQCADDEFFEDTVHGFALQHIEAQGSFHMGEIGFNTPPGIVELCSRFDGVACRIKEGGDEGNLRDPKAFSVDPVLELSHLQAIGQVSKLLLVHPLRTRQRFEPVDALIVLPELLVPA
jgi:hypothetical protein